MPKCPTKVISVTNCVSQALIFNLAATCNLLNENFAVVHVGSVSGTLDCLGKSVALRVVDQLDVVFEKIME